MKGLNSKETNKYTSIKEFDEETEMLKNFTLFFSQTDPDIIVGHELFSSVLEIIFNRIRYRNIDSYSMGRMINNKFGKINNGSLKYKLRQVFSGRLFVDVYELSKTTRKLESYKLEDMVTTFYPKYRPKNNNILESLE